MAATVMRTGRQRAAIRLESSSRRDVIRRLVSLSTVAALGFPAAVARSQTPVSAVGIQRGINLPYLFISPTSYLAPSPEDFLTIRKAGFDHVRLAVDAVVEDPVRRVFVDPSGNTDTWGRLLEATVGELLATGLKVMLTISTFEPINATFMQSLANDDQAVARFAALWRNLAARFAGSPEDAILFELLNEPTNAISDARWNVVQGQLHQAVRSAAPHHWIIATSRYSFDLNFPFLTPISDARTAYTFHLYWFDDFQHQKSGSELWPLPAKGRTRAAIDHRLQALLAWSRDNGAPIINNEWGCTQLAPHSSVNAFFTDVVAVLDQYGIPWTVWAYTDLDAFQLKLFEGTLGARVQVDASDFSSLALSAKTAPALDAIAPRTGLWCHTEAIGRYFAVETFSDGTLLVATLASDPDGTSAWGFIAESATGRGTYGGPMHQFRIGQQLAGPYVKPIYWRTNGQVLAAFFSRDTGLAFSFRGSYSAIERIPLASRPIPPSNGPEVGWWWNPAEAGSLYFLDCQGDRLAVAVLCFRSDTRPGWYLSRGILTTPTQYTGELIEYGNGEKFAGLYAPLVALRSAGQLQLSFQDPRSATLSLPAGRTINIQRVSDWRAAFLFAIVNANEWVQKAYVAYYGRPADPAGLGYWAGKIVQENNSLASIIGAFGNSDEFNRRYGGLSYPELVTRIYQQALGRNPDPAGLAYYVSELQGGRRTLQTITLDVLNGATTPLDSIVVASKLEVAAYYTSSAAAFCAYGTEQDGVNILAGVTASPATVGAARSAIDMRCPR